MEQRNFSILSNVEPKERNPWSCMNGLCCLLSFHWSNCLCFAERRTFELRPQKILTLFSLQFVWNWCSKESQAVLVTLEFFQSTVHHWEQHILYMFCEQWKLCCLVNTFVIGPPQKAPTRVDETPAALHISATHMKPGWNWWKAHETVHGQTSAILRNMRRLEILTVWISEPNFLCC